MPVSVVAERRWSVTAPVSLDGISGSATWSNGGVVGATPIDVAAERGARVIIDVNPLVPIRKHGRRSRADARSVRVTRAATPRMRYRATACWQACRRTHGPARAVGGGIQDPPRWLRRGCSIPPAALGV